VLESFITCAEPIQVDEECFKVLFIFSVPFCALFVYLTYRFYRERNYKQCLVMAALSLFLFLLTLGCLGLGYLWSTYPGELNL